MLETREPDERFFLRINETYPNPVGLCTTRLNLSRPSSPLSSTEFAERRSFGPPDAITRMLRANNTAKS